MGSDNEYLTTREAVLLIIDAAGGQVENRTAIQKLAYFAALAIGDDLGHHAHYYGPYSKPVETALVNGAFSGDFEEKIERFQSFSGEDIRKYTYKLTEQGRQEAEELRRENPTLSQAIDRIVAKLGTLVPGFAQHPLSLAAKVDYIARQHGGKVQTDAIPTLASQFRWKVGGEDVRHAIAILVGLGLVADQAATP